MKFNPSLLLVVERAVWVAHTARLRVALVVTVLR
jgi:hypothetical protein